MLPVNKLSLWDHQKDAVREIINYFTRDPTSAFLVKMPTGTGKTGVFAVLTRVALPNKNYVIITPSKALKFQIIEELKNSFWDKISYDKTQLYDQVLSELMPSKIDDVLKDVSGKNFIIVTTIQALQSLASKNPDKFETLSKQVDHIIFDEGHKEPAYTWGETVRSFRKHTVLFSATPYRNDYKIFNIDKDKFFVLDHNFCTKEHILRELSIQSLGVNQVGIPAFANKLVVKFDNLKSQMIASGIKKPKVIIRVQTASEVNSFVQALKRIKKKVLGIHDTLEDSDSTATNVPTPEVQEKYEYFVHQNKLVEGIDNPDFCLLAIYSGFANSRALIQQIGRILRNPTKNPAQKAFVFTNEYLKVDEEWRKYLEYDEGLSKRPKLFDITDILSVDKDTSTLYFDGTFRELVDVNNIDLLKAILFQKKINVLQHDNSMMFDEFCSLILSTWSKYDYSILKTETHGNKFLVLYIIYSNSPIVKEGIFIEQRLAVTYFQLEKDVIFYYDSDQNHPWYGVDCVEPLSREQLFNVFKDNKRLTKVHLQNTDIGNISLRAKDLHANSFATSAPGLADHSFFPSRLEGYVNKGASTQRRYLGLQYGKISDLNTSRIDYTEFQVWLDDLRKELGISVGTSDLSRVLNRFSQKVSPPINTEPTSILLDLDDDVLESYGYGENRDNLEFDDLCADIAGGTFTLTVNAEDFTFHITYDSKRKCYLLKCPELEKAIECSEEKSPSLIGYLNSNQSFRLILNGNKHVYAYRSFFMPGLNLLSKRGDLDLRQILNPIDCITKCKSEKGKTTLCTNGKIWHKDTLFGIIAREGKGYGSSDLEALFDFDYIMCDDLQDEIADFICLDTVKNRVVMIHAKAGDSKLSASVFHDVCSQATKNLDYMIPFFTKKPDSNLKKWGKKWEIATVGTADRIIKGGCTPNGFWNKYTQLMSNPKTKREVWLFVGNLLDTATLQKELSKTKIEDVKPHVIQLIYLLRSTWSSVSSVNAQLKIFC